MDCRYVAVPASRRTSRAGARLPSRIRLFTWLHATLTFILMCISYVCLFNLSSIECFCLRQREGVTLVCAHEYDVTLVAHSDSATWETGRPCPTSSQDLMHLYLMRKC